MNQEALDIYVLQGNEQRIDTIMYNASCGRTNEGTSLLVPL